MLSTVKFICALFSDYPKSRFKVTPRFFFLCLKYQFQFNLNKYLVIIMKVCLALVISGLCYQQKPPKVTLDSHVSYDKCIYFTAPLVIINITFITFTSGSVFGSSLIWVLNFFVLFRLLCFISLYLSHCDLLNMYCVTKNNLL